MNRTFKWSMIIFCMIGYGELRVMSAYAAMFGIIIAVCALIYAALDIRGPYYGKEKIRNGRKEHHDSADKKGM